MVDPDELSVRKYPKLKYPGDAEVDRHTLFDGTVHVLEKYDGANYRVRWTPDGPIHGSRNVLFHEHGDPLPVEACNDQFQHAIRYVERTAAWDTLDEPGRYTFFGEAMHEHSLEYDAWDGRHPTVEDDYPNVILFDAWDHETGSFLPWWEFESIATQLGFQISAQYSFDGETLHDRLEDEHIDPDELIPESEFRTRDPEAETTFDRRALAEGVVIRNPETGERAKLVHPEFREKNAATFNAPSKAQTEAGRFVATYVTDTRVEKCIHKLLDEGDHDAPTMPMMQELPRRVLTDVMVEHGWEIICHEESFELDDDVKTAIRSRTSSKCSNVLKQIIEDY